jgi:hypothetical protein
LTSPESFLLSLNQELMAIETPFQPFILSFDGAWIKVGNFTFSTLYCSPGFRLRGFVFSSSTISAIGMY